MFPETIPETIPETPNVIPETSSWKCLGDPQTNSCACLGSPLGFPRLSALCAGSLALLAFGGVSQSSEGNLGPPCTVSHSTVSLKASLYQHMFSYWPVGLRRTIASIGSPLLNSMKIHLKMKNLSDTPSRPCSFLTPVGHPLT